MTATSRRRTRARVKNKQPKATYRPRVRFGAAIAAEICERLAQGEAWSRICRLDGMPAYPTLYAWCDRYPEFDEAVARAREMAADMFADRVLEVADTVTSGTASGDRIKVGALQWRAAKAAPHLYGRKAEDRVETQRIIVTVRQFEKAVGPDGKTYLREIPKAGRGK